MEEELLTVREAAARLKVSEKSIKTWLSKGQLRGYKAGRQWRIPVEAMDDFLRGGRAKEQDPE
jgi:excisionase family DNA binding protein